MRIPDPEAIAHAEAQLADVQSTLDEVRHMLRAAEQVERTAQKGIKAWDSIHEIQDLLVGKAPGRTSSDQITVFNNNTGAGTQFAAVGSAVVKRARELGLGRELPTEWFLEDVSP